MYKKTLTVSLALLFLSAGLSAPQALSLTHKPFWAFPNSSALFNNANFWSNISQRFSLGDYASNKPVQSAIHHYQTTTGYIHELTRNAQPYIYYVSEEAQKRGLPAELALLPMIESGYTSKVTSNRGAGGIWQLMTDTAQGFGIHVGNTYDGRRDVVAATHAALNYLAYLHDLFHDWTLAIAAYNCGEGRVASTIRHNQKNHLPTDFWSLPLPEETKQYVPKLLALAEIIKRPGHYNVHLDPVDNHPYFTNVSVSKPADLRNIAATAGVELTALKQLNPALRTTTIAPRTAKPYNLLVPVQKAATVQAALLLAKPTPPTVLVSNNTSSKTHTHQYTKRATLLAQKRSKHRHPIA